MKEQKSSPTSMAMGIFKDAFNAFKTDDVPRMAAALAYHTIFTIGPLILLAVGIAGLFLSQTNVENSIRELVTKQFGSTALPGVEGLLNHTEDARVGATLSGSLLLLWTASSFFVQLRDALNKIWDTEPEKLGIVKMIVQRVVAALLTILLGVVIVAFLGLNVYFNAAAADLFNGNGFLAFLVRLLGMAVSVGIFMGLFMVLYRFLPSIRLDWKDVKFGALVTAILFVIGQFLISLYLARFSPAGSFGAAGTLVVFMLWVYLSGQLFFFGAEVTWAYSRKYGTLAEQGKVPRKADGPPVDLTKPELPQPAPRRRPILVQVLTGVAGFVGGLLVAAVTVPVAMVVGVGKAIRRVF